MTKIFEAYKKRAAGRPDIGLNLSQLGGVRLFPAPPAKQQAEMAQLADRLLNVPSAGQGAAFCFTSTVSGEGTSYVSYNTARILAYALERRVAWIDANFKSPQRKLMNQSQTTFADLLQNPDALEHFRPDSLLALIPGGAHLGARTGQLSSEPAEVLLNRFRERFAYTILDCPPIMEAVETGQLGTISDGMVLVVESRRLKREIVRRGLDILKARQVTVLGAVLNRRAYELPKIIYDRL